MILARNFWNRDHSISFPHSAHPQRTEIGRARNCLLAAVLNYPCSLEREKEMAMNDRP